MGTMFDAIKEAWQDQEFGESLPEVYKDRIYEWFAPREKGARPVDYPAIVLVRSAPDYLAGVEDQTYKITGSRAQLAMVLTLFDAFLNVVRTSGVAVPIIGDRASEASGSENDSVQAELTIRGANGCY